MVSGRTPAFSHSCECLHCKELFAPNARTRWHQKYCFKPAGRLASKVARQRRWLNKPENREVFRESAHVERVRAWRAKFSSFSGRVAFRTVTRLQGPSLLVKVAFSGGHTALGCNRSETALSP